MCLNTAKPLKMRCRRFLKHPNVDAAEAVAEIAAADAVMVTVAADAVNKAAMDAAVDLCV
jgi:hypothetical protein